MQDLTIILKLVGGITAGWAYIWILDGLKQDILLIPHTIAFTIGVTLIIIASIISRKHHDQWTAEDQQNQD